MTKVSQILVSHFHTSFSGCLKRRIQNVANITKELFFAKLLNGFKLLTVLTIYAKKCPLQIFDWVENRLLAKGLKC